MVKLKNKKLTFFGNSSSSSAVGSNEFLELNAYWAE